LLYWWVAGGRARALLPRVRVPQVPDGITRIGEPGGQVRRLGGQAAAIRQGQVSGQGVFVRRWYR
jgi:hypothetical protein